MVNLTAYHKADVLEADNTCKFVPCQHNNNNEVTVSAMLIEMTTKPDI